MSKTEEEIQEANKKINNRFIKVMIILLSISAIIIGLYFYIDHITFVSKSDYKNNSNSVSGTVCFNCDGTGEVREWATDGSNHYEYVDCPLCKGKGYIK